MHSSNGKNIVQRWRALQVRLRRKHSIPRSTHSEKFTNKINETNRDAGYSVLSYYSINSRGLLCSNVQSSSAINAVTWGCFPGEEITQPTIVEKISFIAWKDEFFSILKKWISLFKKDHDVEGGKSIALIEMLIRDYTLMNIVDNDYVAEPNTRIFSVLKATFPLKQ